MSEATLRIPIVQEGGRLRAILPSARTTSKQGSLYSRPAVRRDQAKTLGIFPHELTSGYRWAKWGDRDLLPTTMRRKIEAVPMASRAIYQLMQMMHGDGIAYYRNSELTEGAEVKRAKVPKIEAFMRRNRIKTYYFPAQLLDYRYYMNIFSEMVLNKRRDQIVGLYHKEAEFCRLSLQDRETGRINDLYYSPRFADGFDARNTDIAAIELMDFWNEEEWLEGLAGYKFAWHSKLPTPGVNYYARPLWTGLFKKDGWLDVSSAVPKIINSMQQNQVKLKYQILIPESYFTVRYKEWDTYADAERQALIDTLIDEINDTLSGTDSVYASIATVFQDTAGGDVLGKIEIVAVDDKIKEDSWVPSSETADAQIVQGFGLHPSQVGLAPQGGKMGAGSGSDQRESFNTGITLNTLEQCIVLEALQYVADFNARTDPDWDVTFFVAHTHHTTTNNQESGLVPSDATVQPE